MDEETAPQLCGWMEVQWLKELAVPVEDLELTPRTRTVAHNNL